jgi:hypothetical protein
MCYIHVLAFLKKKEKKKKKKKRRNLKDVDPISIIQNLLDWPFPINAIVNKFSSSHSGMY